MLSCLNYKHRGISREVIVLLLGWEIVLLWFFMLRRAVNWKVVKMWDCWVFTREKGQLDRSN